LLTVAGCEYEWKDEPVVDQAAAYRVKVSNEDAPQQPPQEQPQPTQPTDVRPVLAPGRMVAGDMELPAKVKKLNLPEMRENGALTVSSNLGSNTDTALVYDEIESSLAKSDGINPFKLTFEFNEPRLIKGIKALSTFSDYGWAVQFEGGERFVVDTVVDGSWSTIAWPDGIRAKRVTVEMLRKVRDNYVHWNEVEFYE
jgi:hypothetical protein